MRCPNCGGYRFNPGEEDAHKAVVKLAGKKTKFKGVEAERILRRYYEVLGYKQDTRSNGLLSPTEKTKIVFAKRNIQIFVGGRGNWRKRKSMSKIRAVENVVAKARDALGVETGGVKASQALSETRKKKQTVQDARKRAAEIENLACRAAVVELSSRMTPAERKMSFENELLGDSIDSLIDRHRTILEQTEDLSEAKRIIDSQVSIADPPLFLGEDWPTEFEWAEDGFRIKLKRKYGQGIEIHIGGSLSDVDPFIARPAMLGLGHHEQEGYISGAFYYSSLGVSPGLLLMTSSEKRKGTGTRMLRLFCKLIKAYGFAKFTALGVGEEGAAFIEELERRGEVVIWSKDPKAWSVTCTGASEDPRQQRLWPTFY